MNKLQHTWRARCVLILLFLLAGRLAAWAYDEVNGSYFPALAQPSKLWVVQTWGGGQTIALPASAPELYRDIMTLGSLSGLMMRRGLGEAIYIDWDPGRQFMLNTICARRPITTEYIKAPSSIWDVIARFKSYYASHYVLCDTASATDSLNVARMAAYKYNAIIVDKSREAQALARGLSKVFDATDKTNQWIYDNWWASWPRKDIALDQVASPALNPDSYIFLNDYCAATGAASFFEFSNTPLRKKFLSEMEYDSLLLGWAFDELNAVRLNSINNLMLSACNWSLNVAFMTSTRDKSKLPLKQYARLPAQAATTNTHYVTLIWSDGDNPQWAFEGGMPTATQWWGSPDRGKLHLGWSVAPALRDQCQPLMEYFYEYAANSPTAKDQFIVYSSIGYSYPAYFSPAVRQQNALRLAQYMRDLDIRVFAVLDDGGFDIAEQVYRPYLEQSQIDAIIYADVWGDYNKFNGLIKWVAGKPVIAGRINLVAPTSTSANKNKNLTPQTAAELINSLPRTPTRQEGYSVVRLAAWDCTVTDALNFTKLLGPNVKVVPPETFVQLVRANVRPVAAKPVTTFLEIDRGDWQRLTYPTGQAIAATPNSREQMVDGTPSTKYTFTGTADTALIMPFTSKVNASAAETLEFDVYCDGSNTKLRLSVLNDKNQFMYYDLTLNSVGWRHYSLDMAGVNGLKLSNGATYAGVLASANRLRLNGPRFSTGPGTLYLDNLKFARYRTSGARQWEDYK